MKTDRLIDDGFAHFEVVLSALLMRTQGDMNEFPQFAPDNYQDTDVITDA